MAELAEILAKLTDIVGKQATKETMPTLDIPMYCDEEDIEEWLQRFIFCIDCSAAAIKDESKVKVLMTKLSSDTFMQYKNSCLPKQVTELTFDETKDRLTKLFTKSQSIHYDRYSCMQISREEGESFIPYTNRLKAALQKFRWADFNEELFKCLILLSSLKSPKDARLRQYILKELSEKNKDVKFDSLISEIDGILTTASEAKMLEGHHIAAVHKPIQEFKQDYKPQHFIPAAHSSNMDSTSKPTSSRYSCYGCGSNDHWRKNCPHYKHVCRNCSIRGHLETFCRNKFVSGKPRQGNPKYGNTSN